MGKATRNRKRRQQSTGQPSTASSDPASWQHWLPEGPLDGHDPQTQALLARLATEHHMAPRDNADRQPSSGPDGDQLLPHAAFPL